VVASIDLAVEGRGEIARAWADPRGSWGLGPRWRTGGRQGGQIKEGHAASRKVSHSPHRAVRSSGSTGATVQKSLVLLEPVLARDPTDGRHALIPPRGLLSCNPHWLTEGPRRPRPWAGAGEATALRFVASQGPARSESCYLASSRVPSTQRAVNSAPSRLKRRHRQMPVA